MAAPWLNPIVWRQPTDRVPVLGSGLVRGLGTIVTGGAFRLGTAFVDSALNPVTREFNYQAEARCPNTIPSLEQLMQLGYSQAIPSNVMADYAGFYGVQLGPDPTTITFNVPGIGDATVSEDRHRLWRAVFENSRPHYPLDLLRLWSRQGIAGTADKLRAALKQDGFASPAIQDWFVNAWEPLSESVLLDLYFLQQITLPELHRLMAILGYRSEDVNQILTAEREVLPVGLIVDMLNYGVITDQEARNRLFAHGWTEGQDQDKILLGRLYAPSAADVAAAAARHQWNPDFVAAWGLDNDKPAEFGEWSKRLGLDFAAGTGPYGQPDANAPKWSDHLWRAHWRLPDLGFLSQCIHRFRGDPNNPNTWSQPGYPPLTQDAIWEAMGAAGYPTLMRQYLGRLVYQPISIRHVRMVAQYMNPGHQWIVGAYLDNGYSPKDAELLATALEMDLASKTKPPDVSLQKEAWKKLLRTITESYKIGSMSEPDAATALVSQGVPAATASVMLSTVDMEVANGIIAEVVRRAKADVFAGRITLADAGKRLLLAGMAEPRATQTVAGWRAAFSEGKKTLATDKVLKLLRKGYITKDEAIRRMDNIGWSKPDELLLLAEVKAEIDADRAKAIAAMELGQRQQEKEMEKLLKTGETQVNRIRAHMKELTPPAKVVKWYAQGLWTEDKARRRLEALGFPPDVADTMLLAAIEKSTKGSAGSPKPSGSS